uniref:Uncharacterized protein n=1 Tax=mine drainage metagenome TaxID=410659 RepID=E6Q1C8_9ZZZZ
MDSMMKERTIAKKPLLFSEQLSDVDATTYMSRLNHNGGDEHLPSGSDHPESTR